MWNLKEYIFGWPGVKSISMSDCLVVFSVFHIITDFSFYLTGERNVEIKIVDLVILSIWSTYALCILQLCYGVWNSKGFNFFKWFYPFILIQLHLVSSLPSSCRTTFSFLTAQICGKPLCRLLELFFQDSAPKLSPKEVSLNVDLHLISEKPLSFV